MTQYFSEEQFLYALGHIKLTFSNKKVLQAFLDAEDHILTAQTLAETANLNGGWTAANLRIGELSRKFAQYLDPLDNADDDEPHWWRYIAYGEWKNKVFYWTLRLELKAALLSLDWNSKE